MKDLFFSQKSLLFRFQKNSCKKEFFKKNSRILIACSGGPDSVALFHLMRLAFPSLKLAVVHFNHGIRISTAKRDEIFVKALSKKYGMPFFVGRAKVRKKSELGKLSLEEAARLKRYSFFKTVYKKWKSSAIFFAHHLDDQAETVLMRVCQGTGLRGLLAIREKMIFERMNIVRPLLSFSKSEILDFLKQNQFSFCQDETNQSTNYLRNCIRMEVLPFLENKINARTMHALARIPEILKDENDLIEILGERAIKKVVRTMSAKKVILRGSAFRALHPALQFRVIDTLLKKLDPLGGMLFEHGTSLKSQLAKKRFILSLPRGLELSGYSGLIFIQKNKKTGKDKG